MKSQITTKYKGPKSLLVEILHLVWIRSNYEGPGSLIVGKPTIILYLYIFVLYLYILFILKPNY